MRQITLMLLALLLFVATVAAGSQTKFGIKAGVVTANMSGDGWSIIEDMNGVTMDNKSLMGMAGGLSVEFPLGTNGVSLQPEFLYVMKGDKGETTDAGDTYTVKYKNDYLEIPVLIKYNFTSTGNKSPFMFAGPVAGFNIASKLEVQDPPPDRADLGDFDIENAKSLDFGLTIGGGLGLAMGQSGKLTFDLRYTTGLTNVYDDVDQANDDTKAYMIDDAGNALQFKNNDLRLMVGFQF